MNNPDTCSTTTTVERDENLESFRVKIGLPDNVLPGTESIGGTYNPFHSYATTLGISYNVIDWRKIQNSTVPFNKNYVLPDIVTAQPYQNSDYRSVYGYTVNEFQSNFSNTTKIGGSYNFFSASISTEYRSSDLRASTSEFTRIQQTLSLWTLHIPINSRMRQYVTDFFKNELDLAAQTSSDAVKSAFFDLFGSHILTGIVIGGRAVQAASTNKTKIDRSFKIDVVAEMSYKEVIGSLSASEKAQYGESISSFNASSYHYRRALGGDVVKCLAAFGSPENFDAWKNSIPTLPVFIDFTPSNPVTGIWELCETPEQAQNLQNYYETVWAPEKSAKAQLYPNFVDALSIASGKTKDPAHPEGYTPVGVDLNSKAHGNYIYLCFHKATYENGQQDTKCITDLKVIYDNDPTPSGYTKLKENLNEGNLGRAVYLCYKQQPYDPSQAILDVTSIASADEYVSPPYGYTRVEGDLNKGAKGDYVYACYSKAL